ncbi:nitrate reductase [Oceanobacillus picturae]|jgi:hypothetical protein|uniref:Nitrate reductase n=1 Tax=Oceanobacillus picturae TaxID=171693 RepID=W9ANP9_9BACI|nr:hypothetical protein [Oceanobacillus picturae]GAQ18909.1 nitrate reductase [Oceanobacillus picturae]CDO04261.1 hypothetical protein BN988_02814 [Oceanobacillus picturae]
MKKLISGILIGAVLFSGFMFTQQEDTAVGEREPSVLSIQQSNLF